MTEAPSRVLLIDDHDLIRQGLARAFEGQDDFEVAGQAASVGEGLRLFAQLKPDVLITDVRLPDGIGLELVKELRGQGHDTGMVVLTMYAGDEQLFAAMDAGASAFVGKDSPTSTVISAARQASIAPLTFACTGLAEAIVDLTATGTTLRENGLVVREEIAHCTARLIANRVAHKLRAPEIDGLLERLGAVRD